MYCCFDSGARKSESAITIRNPFGSYMPVIENNSTGGITMVLAIDVIYLITLGPEIMINVSILDFFITHAGLLNRKDHTDQACISI